MAYTDNCVTKYDEILTLIVNDLDFRKELFENPYFALKKKGIRLNERELSILQKIAFSNEEHVRKYFHDGMVLCSSSGY